MNLSSSIKRCINYMKLNSSPDRKSTVMLSEVNKNLKYLAIFFLPGSFSPSMSSLSACLFIHLSSDNNTCLTVALRDSWSLISDRWSLNIRVQITRVVNFPQPPFIFSSFLIRVIAFECDKVIHQSFLYPSGTHSTWNDPSFVQLFISYDFSLSLCMSSFHLWSSSSHLLPLKTFFCNIIFS